MATMDEDAAEGGGGRRMAASAACWVLALPPGDPFAHLLSRQLAKSGREILRVREPSAFDPRGPASPPVAAVVDMSLPEAPEWLLRLKFGGPERPELSQLEYVAGLGTAVLGLSSRKIGDSARIEPGDGIRLRADLELYEPFSLDDVAQAVEELVAVRAARPGLRTVAMEYAPNLERQAATADLIDRLLATCGLPDMPRFMFGCGVLEALDNARLHGTRPGELSDKARVWFEADAMRVTVAVSDNGLDHPQVADTGESPLESARRRNAVGKPGGLGLHMMRRSADEVHYEPQRKRVMLIKRL